MSYPEDLAKDFMSSIYCELSLCSPVSFKKLQVQTQRINSLLENEKIKFWVFSQTPLGNILKNKYTHFKTVTIIINYFNLLIPEPMPTSILRKKLQVQTQK